MDTVYDPARGDYPGGSPPRDPVRHVPSTLDELRAAMEAAAQVTEVEFSERYLYGPGRFIRLACSTELSMPDFKLAQLAGLPPEQRKKRTPDLRKLDEAAVFAKLILGQCTRVELLRDDGSYTAVATDQDTPFGDPGLLAQLGVMDPVVAVRRVFGDRDAYLIRAGMDLQEACGYGERRPGEPGEDDTDPT